MSETETFPAVIVDEEFETLLPPLSAETRARLENDLAAHGQQDSIKVWRETGIVLDGHNRLAILDYLGVDPKIEWFSFPDRDAAKRWILDRALAHRHMTPAQLDYVVGLRYELQKKTAGRPEKLGQNDPVKCGATDDHLAEELGISGRTVKRNAQFARAVDQIAEKAGQEAKRAILNGSVRVKKQDAAVLAEAKPAELRKAFGAGQEGVRNLVAKIRPDHSVGAGKMIEVEGTVEFDPMIEIGTIEANIRDLFWEWPPEHIEFIDESLDKLRREDKHKWLR
jgi:hypothetical protein